MISKFTRRHLGAVRQDDRDAVVPPDAESVQTLDRVGDQPAETVMGECRTAGRQQGRR